MVLGCLAVLSISGCTGLTSAGTGGGKTPPPGNTSGTLAASSTSLSFGNVTVGSTSTPQTLTLSNMGTATVTVSQASITGPGFSIVGGMPSASIAAGQSMSAQVQFAPSSAGSATGSVSIVSDATNSPLAISLNGNGMASLSITAQPVNQSVVIGQTATFSVTASGVGTLTYQWKKGGTAISGATSATYTTPATTNADNSTQFTVVVTDNNGNMTSNAATLTVTASAVAPSITAQPASKTVGAGQTATFNVTATGTSPLTYQWSKNSTAISGATSASYTTLATASSDNNAQFTVTVTNSVKSVTSSAAVLTVTAPTTISAQPAGKTVSVGQTATFSVTATGSGTVSYQWKKNGTAINGATSATYTTPAAAASDNGSTFTVTVTSAGGSVTSNNAILTVNIPPSMTTQPTSSTVIAGQTATFTAAAAGTAPLTYQWKMNGTAISGATSASYTTPATTTGNSSEQFTVTVTNAAGNITSASATLTVNAATFILNASTSALSFSSVNIGSNKILPVVFTNAGNSNVTISNVTVSGAGYAASGVQSGQIINPGKTATLNVTFAPSGAGAVPGTVNVTSNASPASITLSGTGVQATSHSVSLSWTASTSTVAGYNAYRSAVSGGPYAKLNGSTDASISYSDSTVQSGQTYFYVVTSIDSTGVESVNSTEVSAIIP